MARSYGLTVAGVLGILLRTQQEGQLASLADAIAKLRNEAGYRLAPDSVAQILGQDGDHP